MSRQTTDGDLVEVAKRIATLDQRWDETAQPMDTEEQTGYMEDAGLLASMVLEYFGENE